MGHRITLGITSFLLFCSLASPAAAFGSGADTAIRVQVGPGAQLGGQATGVTTWGGSSVPDCTGAAQRFDATYGGGPAVGDVLLHIEVCASTAEVVGSFRIETRVGTLSGPVSGTLAFESSDVRFDLLLTPTSGTRAFAHIRPTLRFSSLWIIGPPGGSPFTATITVV
jgi:hypothetical protein